MLEGDASTATWKTIRDLDGFGAPDEAVWRISVKPSDGPRVAAAVNAALDCRTLYDWGGGLVWIASRDRQEAGSEVIRRAVRSQGGQATLYREGTRLSSPALQDDALTLGRALYHQIYENEANGFAFVPQDRCRCPRFPRRIARGP